MQDGGSGPRRKSRSGDAQRRERCAGGRSARRAGGCHARHPAQGGRPIPHAEGVDAIPPELPALLRQEGHPELQAVQLDVAHGFGEQGLHRLEANIQPDNARCIASVRRLGFRREAFSPRYLRIGGEWRDHERWALPTDE